MIQWATGVVGENALKGIIRHPKLKLAGVKVYSDKKDRLDAGDIINMEKTGVFATKDVIPMTGDIIDIPFITKGGRSQ